MRTNKNIDIEDNVETMGLIPIFKECIESLDLSLDFDYSSKEEFEYRRRDGFIPHSHNKGGIDFIGITSLSSLIGSGSHFNTSIEDNVNTSWEEEIKNAEESFKEEKIEYTDDDIYDRAYDHGCDEYNGYAFRVRIMYEGNNKVCVHYGWDLDAPYYRWKNKTKGEFEISFKTISGLRRQLNKILKTIEV